MGGPAPALSSTLARLQRRALCWQAGRTLSSPGLFIRRNHAHQFSRMILVCKDNGMSGAAQSCLSAEPPSNMTHERSLLYRYWGEQAPLSSQWMYTANQWGHQARMESNVRWDYDLCLFINVGANWISSGVDILHSIWERKKKPLSSVRMPEMCITGRAIFFSEPFFCTPRAPQVSGFHTNCEVSFKITTS